MNVYFLDDGSLIIAELSLDKTKVLSTTLIPPDQFKVVRTTGCRYLRHLSGNEAYNLLVEQKTAYDLLADLSLDKDDL